MPLLAVNVIGNDWPAPVVAMPASLPLPFPLSVKVTPRGSAPVSVNDGVGVPVVVTMEVPTVPTVNVVLLALVMAATAPTVSAKLCVALLPMPLLAVKVIGYEPIVPAAGVPLS